MINQGMIDQGAQALADRIGKLDADLFRGAAEAVLRAALSDKPSPGDRTRTGETARGEACDLAPTNSWSGWDQSNLPWSCTKHQDAVCAAVFGPTWSMGDANAVITAIESALASPSPSTHMTGLADALAERMRQREVENWSPEHDDKYIDDELTRAARCYLIGNPGHWPWDYAWWKPTDRRRDLIKAAALIIAEIERLDRAAEKEKI